MTYQHPIQYFFSTHHPMCRFISADFTGSAGGKVLISAKTPSALEAEASGGVVHSGFATVILDSIMGGAVMGVLTKVQPIATIGMSVHHLRRPAIDEPILGWANCERIHNDVAYASGELKSADGEILAFGSGTFMLGTRGTSIRHRTKDSLV
jgi:acyl-coenzyme A thioesterase PaaI-like protein